MDQAAHRPAVAVSAPPPQEHMPIVGALLSGGDTVLGGECRLLPGESLWLTHETGLQVVEAGDLELFAVGVVAGDRRYLHRFRRGGLLLPLPPPATEAAIEARLVAVAVTEVRLRRIVLPANPGALTPRATSMVGPSVDAWITMLESAPFAEEPPPPPRARGTAKTLRKAGWLPVIEAFNRAAMDGIARTFREADAQEEERLRRLDAQVANDRGRIFGRLAGLLDQRGFTLPAVVPDFAPAGPEGRALATACWRVAAVLGQDFRLRHPVIHRAEPMAQVTETARAARMRTRQVALRGDWWRDDGGPLVGFRAVDGAPVALLPAGGRRYRMVDSDGEETRIGDAQAAALLAPLAVVLYAPFPDRRLGMLDVLRFGLDRNRGDLMVALLMGALAGLLGTAIPLATALIFDAVVPGNERGRLLQIGAALLATGAGITAFHLAADLTLQRVEGHIAGALQAAVVDRILRMPSSFFAGYSSGDLTMRVMVVETIRRVLTSAVLSSLLAGVFSLFSLAVLFYYEPRAALAAGALFAVLVGATVWAGWAQLRAVLEGETLDANIFGLVQEIITGIAKLRLAGAEERMYLRWAKLFAETRSRTIRSRRVLNLFAVFRAGFEVVALGVVFWVLAVVSASHLSAGAFLAFVTAFSSFLASAWQASAATLSVFRVVPLVMRARPIMDAEPEVDDSKADPGVLKGAIEVNAVCFRYTPGGPFVLNDLSLSIKPGEYVAVVGGSGSGKSTLVRLLLGFERPESGAIFYDRQDLHRIDLPALRRQVGVVLQNSRLMSGSVFENVRGVSEAGEAEVWEALRRAGVEEDIRAMPMGLHTVLTEGTSTLSGGQLQRLLIARALIGKPRILLFDEATSALDNRTQSVVTRSLDNLTVTRIVIAHRLSTIVNADRIFVLKNGRLAEQGTYADLMGLDGTFAELARRQLL